VRHCCSLTLTLLLFFFLFFTPKAQGYFSFLASVATLQLLDLSGVNQWILSDSHPEPLCNLILDMESELVTVAWTATNVLGWAHAWETVLAQAAGASDRVGVCVVCALCCFCCGAAALFVWH